MSLVLTYKEALQPKDELQEMIDGCIRMDRVQQARLYHYFYPKMMAMVRRYFPQDQYAEEIINNGFLKAFQKIHTFGFKGSFEGWLRKIIFHCISDYVKANVKYNRYQMVEDKEYFLPVEDADNLVYNDLLNLIQELPESARMVFNMYVMEGMPHKEIGKILEISEGTSKWHLSEARKILKERIIELKLI